MRWWKVKPLGTDNAYINKLNKNVKIYLRKLFYVTHHSISSLVLLLHNLTAKIIVKSVLVYNNQILTTIRAYKITPQLQTSAFLPSYFIPFKGK